MRTESIDISNLTFTAATETDVAYGLLGYLSFVVGKTLRIDGVTVRRTAAGRITLSFPERTDRQGRRRRIVHPIDRDAQVRIERRVLEMLAIELGGHHG